MGEWISVKDKLPELNEWVLAYPTQKDGVAMGYLSKYHGWITSNSSAWWQTPTHWMPLPPAPEEIEGITFEEAEQFYGTKESEE
jgi:hypothetical protein